ncbi:glycoside hydrolase family 3 N-terminal domain-containing protein [Modestobacter lapidis]|nr:glycoside hydrolase family 3 protein [Modestobacter lapidis]
MSTSTAPTGGRWRASVALLAGALLVPLTACGAGSSPERAAASPTATTPAPTGPPPEATASCAERTLDGLDRRERAGQLLMAGVPATDPVSGAAELGDVPVGGVFLRGRSSAGAEAIGAAVAQLQDAATVPLQVAVDQEGGAVQTLTGPGFDLLPTALEQAGQPPEQLRATVAGWARQLRDAGITMDLGPVADTVPAGTEHTNPPIGAYDRHYGTDPAAVAAAVTAVVGGLQDAGVAATVKHFPGLGRVDVNTDTDVGASDPEATRTDPHLEPFRAAVAAGAAAVMVSSATYPQLDPDRPAVFSPAVLHLLRDQLGFSGVVVSDDLGAAVALSGVPVGQRAVAAVGAGVDVVLTVETGHARPMTEALVDRAAADPAFAARVDGSALRVLELKERFGLLTCD